MANRPLFPLIETIDYPVAQFSAAHAGTDAVVLEFETGDPASDRKLIRITVQNNQAVDLVGAISRIVGSPNSKGT